MELTYEERQKLMQAEREAKAIALQAKFIKLTADLNIVAKNDKEFRRKYNFNVENNTIFIKVKYGQQIQIYRTKVGNCSYYGDHRNSALRIQTNYHRINANRLLRDFDSATVAKALHAKIKPLIPSLEAAAYKDKEIEKNNEKETRRIKREQTKLKRKIERAVSYAKVTFYNRSLEADIKIGKIELTTEDGENFRIDKMPYRSTVPLDIIKPLLMWGVMEDSLE